MELNQIVDAITVRAHRMGLRDPESGRVDTAEVESALRDVLQELAGGWDFDAFVVINEAMFTTAVGKRDYALPRNFSRLISPKEEDQWQEDWGMYLYDGTSDHILYRKNTQEFFRDRTATNGRPSWFTISEGAMHLDPPPDNNGTNNNSAYTGRGVYVKSVDVIELNDLLYLPNPHALVDATLAVMATMWGHASASLLEGLKSRAIMRMVNQQQRVQRPQRYDKWTQRGMGFRRS